MPKDATMPDRHRHTLTIHGAARARMRAVAADDRRARRLPGLSARVAGPALVAALAMLAGTGSVLAQVGFGVPADAVQVRALPQQATVKPGDRIPVAVVMDFAEGYHAWPNRPIVPPEFGPDFPAIPTTIGMAAVPPGVQVGAVQWPEPVPVQVDYGTGPIELLSYAGRTVAFVPAVVAAGAEEGTLALDLDVGFQVCDETQCYPPETRTIRAPLEVSAAAPPAPPADPALFAAFDPAGFEAAGAAPGAAADEVVAVNVFGRALSVSSAGATGLGLLLVIALIGGLLLNFTPCVLPVLPLKAMALGRAAGHDRSRLVLLGLSMSLGVILFWLAIGGAIAFVAGFDSISSLFQTGWFAFVVGLVVAAMALGMLGLFDVTLPQSVYRVNPSQDTLHGSFLFGVMTAVLSTPCTAPFMGSAAAWAALQAPPVTMATFVAIGVGMALPYFLLSLKPELVYAVPRSGPASVVVKQVMGLFMLAVAAFFLGTSLATWLHTPPDPVGRAYWYVVIFFIVLACTWMIYRTFQITASPGKRAAFSLLGLGIIGLSLALVRGLASQGPIDWVYYTPERFQTAAARGDVVVVDFTAEWCLNCKALEAGVLNKEEIAALLQSPGVTPMKVDLTGDNPEGRALLKKLGWVGIPLLAVFGPDTGYEDTLLKYDSYTPTTVQDAVREAQSGAAQTSAR